MKNSLLKLTQAVLCLIIILSPTALTSGQTDCSLRWGGAGSDAAAWRFNWCDETPGDVTGTQSGITCRACLAENGVHQGYWAKGGNLNCTAFSKQMIIDFPTPVADLDWEIFGARTVTDNRGYTVRMDPLLSADGQPMYSILAKFPGGGLPLHGTELFN